MVAAYVESASTRHGPATVRRDVSVLHAILGSVMREEIIETNPARGAELPKLPRRRWRILEPAEVAGIERAFGELLKEAKSDRERLRVVQARTLFLTLVLTGIRKGEAANLRWRDVDFIGADPTGKAALRIVESKTEAGERSIALTSKLAEALWEWRRRSAYAGDDELLFGHVEPGGRYQTEHLADVFTAAKARAGVEGPMRPHHDLRHTSLTREALTTGNPVALMARAGHTNMATTKQYLDLAGRLFHEEAAALAERLLGSGRLEQCVLADGGTLESSSELSEGRVI